MKLIPLLIILIPVIILVIVGWLIKYKKAYWLISGYNMMSSEKKKNVDIESLGKFMSNMCFTMAGIILISFVFLTVGNDNAFSITLGLLIPVSIYIIIHSQKYDGNTRNIEGKMKTGTKVAIGAIFALLVVIGISVSILYHYSSKPAEYTLENGILNIYSMYGQEIMVHNITSLELKDTMPEIKFKTNGSALGEMYKGYFTLEGIESAELFVDISKPPFIFLKSGSLIIIFNCDKSEETRKLYEELYKEWEGQ